MPAGAVNVAGVILVASGDRSHQRVADHLGEPDDGIERCAQLVAHIRHELALDSARFLGGDARALKLAHRFAQLAVREHARLQLSVEAERHHAQDDEDESAYPGLQQRSPAPIGEGLVARQSHLHHQRQLLDLLVADDAPQAVDLVAHREHARRCPGEHALEQHRGVEILADVILEVRPAHQQRRVGRLERDDPLLSDIERIEKSQHVVGVDACGDNAAEAAVGAVEAPADEDDVLAVDARHYRIAHRKVDAVALPRQREIFGPGEVECRLREWRRAEAQMPVRIDHHQAGHLRRLAHALGEERLTLAWRPHAVGADLLDGNTQRQIDRLDRARDELLDGEGEVRARDVGVGEHDLARVPRHPEEHSSEDHGDSEGDAGNPSRLGSRRNGFPPRGTNQRNWHTLIFAAFTAG